MEFLPNDKPVYIGNDTAGHYLKSKCVEYFEGQHIPFVDCGSDDDPDIESTRYPFFAAKVTNAVLKGDARCGVLICGTGIGISMAANKFPGIRAALVSSTYLAKMTRRHNNANVLCLGGKIIGEWEAIDILETFLKTQYDGGYHDGSLDLLTDMEKFMGNGQIWLQEPRKISTGPLADAEIFDRSIVHEEDSGL